MKFIYFDVPNQYSPTDAIVSGLRKVMIWCFCLSGNNCISVRMSIHPGTDLYLHWGYTAGSQPFQTPGYIHRRGILIGSSYDQYLFACLVLIKWDFQYNFQVTWVTQVTYCYGLASVVVRCASSIVRRASSVNIFFSRTTGPILTKFGM